MRDFPVKDTTLLANNTLSNVENCLYRLTRNTSLFSIELSSHLSNQQVGLREGPRRRYRWCRLAVWLQAMNISVCNQTKSIQYRLIHCTLVTQVIKNKIDSSISLLCWKCYFELGDFVHCLWSCVRFQSFWSIIVTKLPAIFGVSIQMDTMCLILGPMLQTRTQRTPGVTQPRATANRPLNKEGALLW